MTPSNITRNRLWTVALGLGSFSYFDLASKSHTSTSTVETVVRDWRREGIVECLGKGDKHRLRFQLVNAAALKPSTVIAADRQARQSPVGNMWTAARGLRVFSARDLAAHASTDSLSVEYEVARDYCRALLRAGYLKVVQKARPPEREATYRLIRNSGPLPPVERRVRALWDANLETFTLLASSDLEPMERRNA